MTSRPIYFGPITICMVSAVMLGCGTTRMTDTARTATEQLLISNAVDQAVSQIDFRPLAGKTVFCDAQYLDGAVDRGYVVSSIRQQLLAIGAVIQEERAKATYVVELRSGGIGTDHHSLLVGIPQMTVPTFLPGQPSQIPEIPVAKKTDEQGVAKIAIFAYNRHTGQRVWQSGTVQCVSDARDLWIAGLGPFRAGSIVHGTELAGNQLPNPLHLEFESDSQKMVPPGVPVTSTAAWNEPPPTQYSVTSVIKAFAMLLPKRQTEGSPPALAASPGQVPIIIGASALETLSGTESQGSRPMPARAGADSRAVPSPHLRADGDGQTRPETAGQPGPPHS
jgi:hypothetical protein